MLAASMNSIFKQWGGGNDRNAQYIPLPFMDHFSLMLIMGARILRSVFVYQRQAKHRLAIPPKISRCVLWYLNYMVTLTMLRTHEGLVGEKNPTALDLIRCLKQIKCQRLHPTLAPLSVLPSNISTMMYNIPFSCF